MLNEIPRPEIFIGIVAPVGVGLAPSIEQLGRGFERHGYSVVHIKVTDVFSLLESRVKTEAELDRTNTYRRIKSFIEYGNEIREIFDKNEILAAAAVADILKRRRKIAKDVSPEKIYSRRVYIINQLKRPEEVDLLRKIYGDLFFQVSVFSRRETRLSHIASKCRNELAVAEDSNAENMALELVTKDENEAGRKYGQRVAKIFHTADFIINADINKPTVEDQVSRFCELIFGSNTISPTKLEYGMYGAKVAALRTLDLSRQVGAALFSPKGEVISTGTNEVPKGGGGSYWSDEDGIDAREFKNNVDTNDLLKKVGAREFYGLATKDWSGAPHFDEFVERPDVRDAQVMDALEYGRIVHAEMTALMDAARNGKSVRDAFLYTTTFPCHLCAKHIVASGVKKVVYLEPYPKSLVFQMFPDSIQVDGGDRGKFGEYPVVEFLHFHGITPRRYRELFERAKRKDKKGSLQEYRGGRARPIMKTFSPSYSQLETRVVTVGLRQLFALSNGGRVRPEGDVSQPDALS